MRDLLLLAIHLFITIAKLLRPGGVHTVAAESLLLKQQLIVSNRSRQRAPNLAIARALAQQPDVIIADEPVASLDPRIGAGILELLRSICHAETSGVAVICSLHQPHLARQYADRVVGLAGGRIVLNKPAADFTDQNLQDVYGSKNDSEDMASRAASETT